MRGCFRAVLSAVAILTLVAPASSWADPKHFNVPLTGFQEVATGIAAVFSTGSGQLTLKVNEKAQEIAYELTYDFPDAGDTTTVETAFVNQAHLHFGQKSTAGGIVVWLCQGDNVGPVGTPTCPSPFGTVSGVIRPANVLAVTGQGFPAGADGGFDALLEALRAGAIYGNVHTDRFGSGEIRGQVDKHSHH
jgi:hypothetical protein